jgi:hypothetical protein
MTYVFRRTPSSRMLCEVSAHDARLIIAGRHDQACHGVVFEACSAAEAHRWVRSGAIHCTALFIDMDGRIRRARDDR